MTVQSPAKTAGNEWNLTRCWSPIQFYMKGDAMPSRSPAITVLWEWHTPVRASWHPLLLHTVSLTYFNGLHKWLDEDNLHLLDHKLQADQCCLLSPSLEHRNWLNLFIKMNTWHDIWYPLSFQSIAYNIKGLLLLSSPSAPCPLFLPWLLSHMLQKLQEYTSRQRWTPVHAHHLFQLTNSPFHNIITCHLIHILSM